jgi:Mrp family chromosome partitioning ATPase
VFGLADGPGFAEVLRGQAEARGAARPTPVPGLWLLPAGRCDDTSLRALAQGRARSVFAGLRDQYDCIIIDSPPVLPVADALLIGQCVDAAVFSILREVSRMPSVHAAYERLATLGVRVLGAVVNGVAGDLYAPAYLRAAAGAKVEANAAGPDAAELPAAGR